MPPTFRKGFRILPGVRLSTDKYSWSVAVGGKRRTATHPPQQGMSYDIG